MSQPPANPKIYHITHLDNLAPIIQCGCVWSDAQRIAQSIGNTNVGMTEIKSRRLTSIQVSCQPGTYVGEYVPFYFCPRSVMLYLLYMRNHPDLSYRGGQRPLLHLQADLHEVARWADDSGTAWAFTTGNAGAYYADFYNTLADLKEVNWRAVQATDFTPPGVKEAKQAEFLVYQSFPWQLVERIGVIDTDYQKQVSNVLMCTSDPPAVVVERGWYY